MRKLIYTEDEAESFIKRKFHKLTKAEYQKLMTCYCFWAADTNRLVAEFHTLKLFKEKQKS